MISIKNILTAIFVIGIFALHPSMNKGENPITYLHYFVYGNDVTISADNAIDKTKVMVKWSCENDDANCKELIIYQNGKMLNNIPFEMGNQALFVYYNNRIVGTLNQFKTNKTQAHQYRINLQAVSDLITFNGEIIGPAANKVSETVSIADLILAKH